MATGTLGQASLTATTNTTIYTVPVGKTATFNVSICNTNASAVTVRLAICATSTPAAGEYLEYDATIPANGVLERTGLVASASKLIVGYANTANVNFNVFGYEE
jgi:hypothetical protein